MCGLVKYKVFKSLNYSTLRDINKIKLLIWRRKKCRCFVFHNWDSDVVELVRVLSTSALPRSLLSFDGINMSIIAFTLLITLWFCRRDRILSTPQWLAVAATIEREHMRGGITEGVDSFRTLFEAPPQGPSTQGTTFHCSYTLVLDLVRQSHPLPHAETLRCKNTHTQNENNRRIESDFCGEAINRYYALRLFLSVFQFVVFAAHLRKTGNLKSRKQATRCCVDDIMGLYFFNSHRLSTSKGKVRGFCLSALSHCA